MRSFATSLVVDVKVVAPPGPARPKGLEVILQKKVDIPRVHRPFITAEYFAKAKESAITVQFLPARWKHFSHAEETIR